MNDRSRNRAEPSGCDVPPFDVSVRSDDPSAWVIEMRGELDIATGPRLKDHLGSFDGSSSSGGDSPRIVDSLSKLEFLDFPSFHCRLTAVNGHGPETITLREPSQAVNRVLQLVGMNSPIEADS